MLNGELKVTKPARYAACAIVLFLSACVQVRMGEHVKAEDYGGSPKRIFVFNELDARFDPRAAAGFGPAIQAELARCGVASAVYRRNSMQLDAEAKLRAAMLNLKPDSLLDMRQSERFLYEGEVRSGTYILTLRDLRQKREVWKASMSLGSGSRLFVDRAWAGAEFAASVVGQMSRDGLLKSCPPPAPKPG